MKFSVAFDSTRTIADWWILSSPLLIIFAILTAYVAYVLWTQRHQPFLYRTMLIVFVVLIGVRIAMKEVTFWILYRGNYHYVGPYRVVEGTVQDYKLVEVSGVHVERFSVNGVGFAYANNGMPQCFHKTAYEGGPIRDGLPVRIAYASIERRFEPACIVRLEIRIR